LFLPDVQYTMLGEGDEEEYRVFATEPHKALSRDGAAVVYNLTPVTFVNVTVSDENGVVAQSLDIAPWTKVTIASGSEGEVFVDMSADDNPVLNKI
jgi:hypothetical protein